MSDSSNSKEDAGSKLRRGDKRQRLDLREETLNRRIFELAWPAILGNLMYSVVFVADTIIVGWLKDDNALAAAGIIGVAMWLFSAPYYALAAASVSLVSRYWGERDFDLARKFAGQSTCIAFLISFSIILVSWPFTKELVLLLGASEQVAELGGPYFRIILGSCLLGMPMIVAEAIMRGAGDTRTPMYLTVTMNLINVAASIAFAFGLGPLPAMGLFGVAWGTVVARSCGGLAALAVLRFAPHGVGLTIADVVLIRFRHFWRVLILALPVMLDRALISGAHMIFIRIVAMLGTTALAAHTIALHVESLVYMPAMGIAFAVTTVVGQAIGAGRIQLAELAVKRTMLWSSLFMLVLSLLFVFTSAYWIVVFGAQPEALELGLLCVQVSALELPSLALAILLAGVLRGAGDTRSPLYVSLIGVFLFRLGAVYLFAITFGWGMVGIWLGTALDWTVRAFGLWYFFKRGAWKKIHQQEKKKYD